MKYVVAVKKKCSRVVALVLKKCSRIVAKGHAAPDCTVLGMYYLPVLQRRSDPSHAWAEVPWRRDSTILSFYSSFDQNLEVVTPRVPNLSLLTSWLVLLDLSKRSWSFKNLRFCRRM